MCYFRQNFWQIWSTSDSTIKSNTLILVCSRWRKNVQKITDSPAIGIGIWRMQRCKLTRLRHSKASWWSPFSNGRDWQKMATIWSPRSRSNPLRTTPVPFPVTLWDTNTVRLGYHSDTISSNQEFKLDTWMYYKRRDYHSIFVQ